VHNACGDDTISGYFSNVGKTMKGMVWTGPKRFLSGAWNTGKAIVTDPAQAVQNAYWGTGEAIYGGSAFTYNTAERLYNDPLGTAIAAKDGAIAGANYLLDNPEEVGAGYFDVSASIVGGKIAQSGIRVFSGAGKAANIAEDLKVASKVDDLGAAVKKTTVDLTMNNSGARTTELASKELIEKMRSKGRVIKIAEEGSDELKYLKRMNANANAGGEGMRHIILRYDATKVEALEEFFHGTQSRLGIVSGTDNLLQGEIHVKRFMTKKAKLLGISPEDVRILNDMLGDYK